MKQALSADDKKPYCLNCQGTGKVESKNAHGNIIVRPCPLCGGKGNATIRTK